MPTTSLRRYERFITVSSMFRTHERAGPSPRPHVVETQVPSILLQGKWLKAAGCDPQMKVRVRVMAGCLVLRTD
ncbi:SymE family type I addiction module toxin [Aquabacterium sp. A7-Y]|uniref:SymE family type I addiction module toxin n=1 Tax=Aquabacterium sp. A7-Y TaxID=1349605 RepID=UPI0039FBD410